MIKLDICCLVLIIGSVEVGPDIDMKFHQEVMEIVSYDIDIAKIVKDDKPKHDRKRATEIERQLKEKEAKILALEKAK